MHLKISAGGLYCTDNSDGKGVICAHNLLGCHFMDTSLHMKGNLDIYCISNKAGYLVICTYLSVPTRAADTLCKNLPQRVLKSPSTCSK